jgi:hypothetical protein
MIPIFEFPYGHGHINIGWASWDDGSKTSVSIKYAYPDSRGRISRGSPEIALEDFLVMREFFLKNEKGIQAILNPGKEFTSKPEKIDVQALSKQELLHEGDELRRSLLEMQRIQMMFRWLPLEEIYNDLGKRYEDVKAQLETMAA